MSDSDKAVVANMIREAWPGERVSPRLGLVLIPKVREGGLTDVLIKLSAEIADKYYRRKYQRGEWFTDGTNEI
jgi:hypothetical protein